MGVFEGAFPQWAYLIGYNTVSALLWLTILGRTALAAAAGGLDATYPAMRTLVLFTQTLAALDILHAAIGLVRAPVPTTAVQVAGRSTVLWAVIEAYPSAAAGGMPYGAMVLAWSAADTVRYLYFAARLVGGGSGHHPFPRLVWLRYSAFYVLYPVGIASEVAVVSRAVSEAFALGHAAHAWGYIAAAMLYIPAAPTLFNHMRRQRRKVLAKEKK